MKTRFFWSALSLSERFASSAAAQGPAPAPHPAAPPAPAGTTPVVPAQEGVTNRALPDRPRATFEGLEPEAGGPTSDEVARRALAASASVKEKRAQLDAANEKITETTFQFFPRTTLLASY